MKRFEPLEFDDCPLVSRVIVPDDCDYSVPFLCGNECVEIVRRSEEDARIKVILDEVAAEGIVANGVPSAF